MTILQKYRETALGARNGSSIFKRLAEVVTDYNNSGQGKAILQEYDSRTGKSFILCVVTGLMSRVHEKILQSAEICYMDASSDVAGRCSPILGRTRTVRTLSKCPCPDRIRTNQICSDVVRVSQHPCPECPSVRVSFFEHLLLAFSVKHKVIASGVFLLISGSFPSYKESFSLYSDYILSHPAFFFILKFFFSFFLKIFFFQNELHGKPFFIFIFFNLKSALFFFFIILLFSCFGKRTTLFF